MSFEIPRLYPRSLFADILSAPESIRIVLGGPHMGTTASLAAIQREMQAEVVVSARRDPAAARQAIEDWSQKKSKSICIDAVDFIIAEITVQRHLIDAHQGQALLGGFFSIDRARECYRAAATEALSRGQHGSLSPTDLWWQKSRVCYLNPWGYPNQKETWEARQTEVVTDCLQETVAEAHVGYADGQRIRSFAASLVRAAGGHPALVGRGYQILCGWLAAGTMQEDVEAQLRAELKDEATDVFLDAARAVRRETPEGFAAAVRLARGLHDAPRLLPHADLLRASGLVREVSRDRSAVWEFVHEQAGPALLYVADQPPVEAASVAPTRQQLPRVDGGRVRVRWNDRHPGLSGPIERVDDGSLVVLLTGTQWTLFKLLVDAKGAPVTVAEMARRSAKARTAVVPGLQRLRKKLDEAGLQALVYNCDGSGYAVDTRRVEC